MPKCDENHPTSRWLEFGIRYASSETKCSSLRRYRSFWSLLRRTPFKSSHRVEGRRGARNPSTSAVVEPALGLGRRPNPPKVPHRRCRTVRDPSPSREPANETSRIAWNATTAHRCDRHAIATYQSNRPTLSRSIMAFLRCKSSGCPSRRACGGRNSASTRGALKKNRWWKSGRRWPSVAAAHVRPASSPGRENYCRICPKCPVFRPYRSALARAVRCGRLSCATLNPWCASPRPKRNLRARKRRRRLRHRTAKGGRPASNRVQLTDPYRKWLSTRPASCSQSGPGRCRRRRRPAAWRPPRSIETKTSAVNPALSFR